MISFQKNSTLKLHRGESGYSMIELMIALVISSLVMATVATVFFSQSGHYTKHDDVAAIQQNLRGALTILPMEIRLAGCDPTESNEPKVLIATRTSFQFTRDLNGDGDVTDPEENIAYGFTADTDADGIAGGGVTNWAATGSLGRQTGGAGGFQPLAENIEAVEFNYILKDNTTSLAPTDLRDIRAVQVTLLARTPNPDLKFADTATYTTPTGAAWDPPAAQENFHRRMVSVTIQSRNLGY